MTMTKLQAMSAAAAVSERWSGIDAGRREQAGLALIRTRYFRRSRRAAKPQTGPLSATRPLQAQWARPTLDRSTPLQLKGGHAYLRELRRLEMEAWERSGGDIYRPLAAAPSAVSGSPRPRLRSVADLMPISEPLH